MSTPLVVVEDLRKTFVHMGRELHVLCGIDIVINQGEVVAFVGPSGAGKSTFLHCIGTLDLPTSGRIRLGSDELTGMPSSRLAAIRNRMIGFVFQFHHLLPEFNAVENVMMPGLIQGKTRREMEPLEQQRVALARALVLSPKLLLADEPTGNLDTATSDSIHQLFFEMNRKHGTTVVVVTHNLSFAESMPRVVTMRDGAIESDRIGSERAAAAGYRGGSAG